MSGLVFPCILGAIIGLIVLNYRHSLRCENAIEHDETEDFVNALERRLATAELMGASNDKLMERLKYLLTERLTSVDAGKLDAIYANAEAIAVKDALKLQSVVGLPFPNVLSSNTGIGGESEGDALLDNAYSTASFAASGGGGGSGDLEGAPDFDDDDYYSTKMENSKRDIAEGEHDDVGALLQDDASKLTDGQRTELCASWLVDYKVTLTLTLT